MYLSNLGNALQARYERAGQEEDLDETITLHEEAVAATPDDHPNLPMYLSNLGNALLARYERAGQEEDLDETITLHEKAVAATPDDHPNLPGRLANLANTLQARFQRTGQQHDLDEAITLHEKAVAATPDDHPNRPRRLANLGNVLQARFQRTGQRRDLDEAVTAGREGAGVVTAAPQWRLHAAREWGRCAVLAQDFHNALQAYTVAIELLPLMAWHGLDQPTREHHLREWSGLASEATTTAIVAGDPRRAVELAEAGRATLWTQALHLRYDLTALQQRAPHQAAVLERARTVLNSAPASRLDAQNDFPGSSTLGDQARAAERRMLEERRRAAREWDAAVRLVRRLEDFEHFLRPVPFTDLRAAAADGPVVIVNISPYGSHALIITPEPGPDPDLAIQVVDLPAAPLDTVIDQANTLLAARSRSEDPATDWQTEENDRHAVFDVLDWAWQAVTEPVLDVLGHTDSAVGKVEDWPRVWWCSTGPAAVLPLHAAGRHPRTNLQYTTMGEAAAIRDSVAGRVVSSYTLTLTALTRARARPTLGPARQLAVGVPDAPGQMRLDAVASELEVLSDYLPEPDQATHLLGPTATRDAVLRALPVHPWLHLSCHGVQHPSDASRSAFLLHDHPLTLGDLTDLNLPDAELAYLAACQTATGDLQLLDESLHLAAALQMVGYRHILATLWSISDAAAPAMANTTYAHLAHPEPDHPNPFDRAEATRAAHALHHAVTQLRQLCPSQPLLWGPYIHLGP
jgi:tetratricopeptide (TPR) repeat protein